MTFTRHLTRLWGRPIPAAAAMLEELYGFLATPLEQVGLAEAEMLK